MFSLLPQQYSSSANLTTFLKVKKVFRQKLLIKVYLRSRTFKWNEIIDFLSLIIIRSASKISFHLIKLKMHFKVFMVYFIIMANLMGDTQTAYLLTPLFIKKTLMDVEDIRLWNFDCMTSVILIRVILRKYNYKQKQ